MKKFCCLLLFSLVIFAATTAQNRSDFERAESIVKDAIEQLQIGNANKADSLIQKSIVLYPTKSVIEYAAIIGRNSDVIGANTIMRLLIDKVSAYSDKKMFVRETFAAGVSAVVEHDARQALGSFLMSKLDLSKALGIRTMIEPDYEELLSFHKSAKDGDYYVTAWKIEYAILQKRYNDALQLNKNRKKSSASERKAVAAWIYRELGDYQKSIEINSESTNLFAVYALMGKPVEAMEQYNKLKSGFQITYSVNMRDSFYLALIDMSNFDYSGALRKLLFCAKNKGFNNVDAYYQYDMDLWKIYKTIGDAYVGSKQYDKAKDNYNISLLMNPDYEPAIAAFTKLESSIATTTSTDKTPPSIAVTEPSVKRGLQVTTSGNDVMVRGIAEDPSGLKSVSINGQSVYAQASGNFWGNIVLKNGLNKITIKATDGAGNIAEETFEITKNNTPAPETEIVAVTAKEGKNYCLLIAAQNYADATIPSLENPIQDAVRLKLVLKKNYNFTDENIITLFNPNANDIKRQLLELTNVIQPEDNLLIFYAGHGIWVEKEKKGYWLMTDAKRNDPNTWVSNKDVLNLIAKLPSRHTLLITDACFSGGVFKTRSITKDAPSAIQMMDAKVSRVAITSGNDTEVPDQSVFMKYLVKALSENKEQYLPAQKMFITHIMEAVMTEGKTEPRYGTLELAGHVGGDFIFMKK